MNYNKGDLILAETLNGKNITCIVLSLFEGSEYLYCYCVDDGVYKLIYRRDIQCVLVSDFDPDFPDDKMFDLDYSFYAACYEAYNYYPTQVPFPDDDDEDED